RYRADYHSWWKERRDTAAALPGEIGKNTATKSRPRREAGYVSPTSHIRPGRALTISDAKSFHVLQLIIDYWLLSIGHG
ncbi:MAG: hypothetical protein KDG51_24140, partial [Calditrichaeota bacterium]|nr:hypothetical protein [Calditrichota bacterium]